MLLQHTAKVFGSLPATETTTNGNAPTIIRQTFLNNLPPEFDRKTYLTIAAAIIKNWIRNRGTIEFLGTWESFYNPNFKVVEFDHFRKESSLPTFTMSINSCVEKTSAIGIFSKQGRYGGTYAHKDIAFEFGSA